MPSELAAVSPIDGRYHETTAALAPYTSEAALMRARLRVEVEYLIHLAEVEGVELSLSAAQMDSLRDLYEEFDTDAAELIKRLETEGTSEYPATNHDVKAIEYYLRMHTAESVHPWLHFGLTSEDVNNLAYRLLIDGAVEDILLPQLVAIRDHLTELATRYAEQPMLARTHGQPATPTTFGKEMAVFADRLERALETIDDQRETLTGKLGGATGTYSAHQVAYPEIDWPAVGEKFVTDLGFDYVTATTQINPGDDLAGLFHALLRANQILIDLDQDCWRYIAAGYLGQEATDGETGSSTMPHKVNPIDFENSEGNLQKANTDLEFLAEALTTSRLQRDLSDSTVKRTIGPTLAHCLLGYTKTNAGLETVVANPQAMHEDLAAHPEVLAEAVQTLLRKAGHQAAYEEIKQLTRGQSVSLETLRDRIETLEIPEDLRSQLRTLTPAEYTGYASEIATQTDS